MSYPSLEQYNEAFQHPESSLTDPELKQGTIATTGLGLPLALCGGFALTYTLKSGAKKFAVRCFHKQSNALEKRYSSIARRLKILRSAYFVEFEFQPQGVRVSGQAYPVVKMAWATGTTLGEFLEQHYKNAVVLNQLQSSLRGLATFLESQKMAHGDIQPGNVMVANDGKKIQLIDYDGMFVDDLHALGSAELGHRNFQHPQRSGTCWDPALDRFSFIGIDLALRALQAHPELWTKTQSDGDAILFKANDFADPGRSAIFADLLSRPVFSPEAAAFVAICRSPYSQTPTLEDFLTRQNLPQIAEVTSQPVSGGSNRYLSAFPVLDASSYAGCLNHVGDKVELIGQIFAVRANKTRNGRPYVFINFGLWTRDIVKLSIWSEALQALADKPTQDWVGKWISVIGLLEPPYINKEYKYSHLSISIAHGNQFHFITAQESKFRLSGSATRASPIRSGKLDSGEPASGRPSSRSNNQDIMVQLREAKSPASARTSVPGLNRPRVSVPAAPAPITSNEAILVKMRKSQPSPSAPLVRPVPPPAYTYTQAPTPKPPEKSNCFIATAVYGGDAPETHALRAWRDHRLMRNRGGRIMVAAYYRLSPSMARLLARHGWLRRIVKPLLDKLVGVVGER